MLFNLNTSMHLSINKSGQVANDKIEIINGRIILNGIELEKCDFNLTINSKTSSLGNILGSQFNVTVNGNVGNIDTVGPVTVTGNSGKINTTGSVNVGGDVRGNIDTTGSVTANNVTGNIDTIGRVTVNGRYN